jgi:hypothetical protein
VVSENFEFRNKRNRTRVIMRSMTDFQSVKFHFDSQNLSYYSIFPKSETPIKAVIPYLPHNTPSKDISDGPLSLGFDVVSFKQIKATRRSPPEESKVINLPLFLVTLPRTAKSQEILPLPCLCHIAIRGETYRAQNALPQYHNCQQFVHVWANTNNLSAACSAGEDTCTRTAQRRETLLPHKHAVTASWRSERKFISPITEAADMRRDCYRSGSHREHPRLQREWCSQISPPQLSPSRRRS